MQATQDENKRWTLHDNTHRKGNLTCTIKEHTCI
jgi:hypothetical protein